MKGCVIQLSECKKRIIRFFKKTWKLFAVVLVLLLNPVVRVKLMRNSFFERPLNKVFEKELNANWENRHSTYWNYRSYGTNIKLYNNSYSTNIQPLDEASAYIFSKWEQEGLDFLLQPGFFKKYPILKKSTFIKNLDSAISIYFQTIAYDIFPEEEAKEAVKKDVNTLLYGGNILEMSKLRFYRSEVIINRGIGLLISSLESKKNNTHCDQFKWDSYLQELIELSIDEWSRKHINE